MTGLDALRAAAADGDKGGGASLAVEALVAGGGALLVLAFVFASWMAIVPLLMAIVAIPTTFLLIWPLATATDVSVIVKFLVALIGLAIAIDYALLVVVRWREERLRPGTTNEDAVVQAMQHAGRAVVFSGTTVGISLLALVVLPVPFLRSIGIAGMLIPLVSVAVAITLLPVVLATIGPRLDRPAHAPHRSRRAAAGRPGPASSCATAGPRPSASTAVLGALVVAASSIQLGNPRADSLAQSGPARAGLDQLTASGIGTGPLSPFDALVRSGDPAGRRPRPRRRRRRPERGRPGRLAPRRKRRSSPSSRPRTATRPRAARRSTASAPPPDLPADVVTGGEAAQSADFLDAVYGNFPLVIALITVLTFLLLARAFRSLVLPLKAVLLNLLSVAAAWGLMVLVWQHGWGSDAIWGIEATGAINVEMPIVVFAFLFGISMDYQVFILSRMREAYDRTGSTDAAVVEGIGRTGRLVTSAALILGLAFVAMSAGPGTEAKMFATALGGGILLDATLIRGVLAPGGGRAPRPLELVAAASAGAPAARRAVGRDARGRRRPSARLAAAVAAPTASGPGAIDQVAAGPRRRCAIFATSSGEGTTGPHQRSGRERGHGDVQRLRRITHITATISRPAGCTAATPITPSSHQRSLPLRDRQLRTPRIHLRRGRRELHPGGLPTSSVCVSATTDTASAWPRRRHPAALACGSRRGPNGRRPCPAAAAHHRVPDIDPSAAGGLGACGDASSSTPTARATHHLRGRPARATCRTPRAAR